MRALAEMKLRTDPNVKKTVEQSYSLQDEDEEGEDEGEVVEDEAEEVRSK